MQVFHCGACYLSPGLHHHLGHLRVGQRQAFGVVLVGIEKNLEDVARRHELLVDDCSDVEVLGLADKLEVLHVGDGLRHSELLGRETRQDVGLRGVGERQEGVILVDGVLAEHLYVASVAVHYLAVRKHSGQLLAAFAVDVDYLEMHLVVIQDSETRGNRASPHDEGLLDHPLLLAA